VPLWRGDHVAVKQLVEDFARYLYLPRLRDPSVLLGAVRDGLRLVSWMQDAFAFADSFDENESRYRGLRAGQIVTLADAEAPGLLVKPEVAHKQMETERPQPPASTPSPGSNEGEGATTQGPGNGPTGGTPENAPITPQPKRFHGTVVLDPARVGRDAGRIAEEVIAHLSGLVGAKVTVTLEVEAEIPIGAPDHVVRTVTENSRTLKFTSQGFEKE
jgi:hypothetical protein